ncbi:MAG: glycosyltransferase family 2 protein [Acidobacteriaceae bacterium]
MPSNNRLSFSVGIPAYNQGAYLEETILSLLNQNRPPDEIVISDQQSTDETPEIIAKYSKYVKGVVPPLGCGISGQWNFTLSNLSGDWCTLLSSDDIARPNFCEVLLRGASRRTDAVLVRAGWENIDRDGKVLSCEYLLSVDHVVVPPKTLFEQKNGPKASFAAFAVRRDVLVKSGMYPANMESFGDWPMFAQLAPYGAFIYEAAIISGYRIGHDGNKFRKRLGMWLRDEQRMFYEVFPLAADRLGMKDRNWIHEASKANLQRYLVAASKEYSREERVDIVPLFESWTKLTQSEKLLEEFARGANIKAPFSFTRQIKRKARPFVQNLYNIHRRFKSSRNSDIS